MEDREIIALYWGRKDEAITQSQEKYGPYCYAIAHNILSERRDSEECVNDTWLNAWQAMPPHRPDVLKLFFAKITRSLSFNRFKANHAQKRGGGETMAVLEELSECIAGTENPEGELIAQELGESVRRFISALPEREANLFLRRYFYTESVSSIAERYHLSKNYTSVSLKRTRAKLKAQLMKEGYFDGP